MAAQAIVAGASDAPRLRNLPPIVACSAGDIGTGTMEIAAIA
jgi:hypothetical protein